MDAGFVEGFEYFAQNAGAQIAANGSAERIVLAEEEIAALAEAIEVLGTNKSVDFLSGDIAEYLLAHTFNIDAILSESENRATVPRVTSFASPDIVLNTGEEFQVKFYADGAKSARAQSVTYREASNNPSTKAGAAHVIAQGDVDPNSPIYKGMGRVIPKDQKADAELFLDRKAAKESVTRKSNARRYVETKENLTEVVEDRRGVASKSFSREESKQIAREAKEGNLNLEDYGISMDQMIKARHILASSIKAGMSAAMIAAVLKAGPLLVSCVEELVATGEVDLDRLQDSGTDLATNSGAAFVTGSISSAIVEAMHSGLLGESAKDLNPSIVASATVVAVNAIRNGVKVAKGEMGNREFADAVVRDTFVSAVALAGGAVGQAALPMVPMIGYLLGSFVGSAVGGITYNAGQSLLMSFAVEKGITFFGIVDQDYELPESTLESLGIEVFEYERFMPDSASIDKFSPDVLRLDPTSVDTYRISFPKRGVIGFGKVGYIDSH